MTEARKAAFLAALPETGNISLACGMAGVNRTTHYRWLQTDTEYAESFAYAMEEAGDNLEFEARRRAVDGWDEPVFQQGRQVGVIHRYSDPLLMMLLRGAKPEVYGNRVNVAGSVRHKHASEPLTQVSSEMLEMSGTELLEAMKQRLQDIRTGKAGSGIQTRL